MPTKSLKFNDAALALMQKFYAENAYPNQSERRELAAEIGETEPRVFVSFV